VKVTFYRGPADAREAVPIDGKVVGSDTKNDIAVISVAVSGAPDQMAIATPTRATMAWKSWPSGATRLHRRGA